jgi:Tol biopolymer transport system component
MLLCLLVAVPTAQAAFPGTNGKILFTRWTPPGEQNLDIYTVNPDGSGVTNIDNSPLSDEFPAWSPDGTKIAFSRRTCPGGTCTPFDIYVMNADGSAQVNVTNNGLQNYDPAWSPDGTKIAFASRRTGTDQIYVMDADGTGQTQLTASGTNDEPAWSPDGHRIAFRSVSQGRIYIMSTDGTGQTRSQAEAPIANLHGLRTAEDRFRRARLLYRRR